MVINGVKFEIAPESNLRNANLQFADLSGANLWGANLWGSDLTGVNLSDADLQRADFRFADLSYSDLSGANLQGASLRGTDLRDADLNGADLRSANLSGADLSYPIIQMGPGGSRKDYVVYKTGIDEVMTGCFRGTLEDFIKRVETTYPDGPHRRWYDAVINAFQAYEPNPKN